MESGYPQTVDKQQKQVQQQADTDCLVTGVSYVQFCGLGLKVPHRKVKLLKSKVLPVHDMKAYVGGEVQLHPILHSALNGGESSGSYPQSPRYPSNRKMARTKNTCEYFVEKEILLPRSGIEQLLFRHSAHNAVTIPAIQPITQSLYRSFSP